MRPAPTLALILGSLSCAASASAKPALIHALELAPKLESDAPSEGLVEAYDLSIEIDALSETDQIELMLPDGLFEAEVTGIDVREDGAFWRGTIHDTWEVYLTERKGTYSGLIYTPWVVYELGSGPDGRSRLTHVDQDAFPDCGDVIVPDLPDEDVGAELAVAEAPVAEAVSQTVIDIMVLYSSQARTSAGGTSQIESLIRSAVDVTNAAYANSQVSILLNLVYTGQAPFAEVSDYAQNLYNLQGNSTVATLRNTYGADMVSMIVNNTYYCGIGFVQRNPGSSFAGSAFQVTSRTCAVGNLSFAHEFGHNMGAEHNPSNSSASASTASYPYSFGHYYSGHYRTVMSYSNPCSGGCNRAPYFSNPSVSYQSRATGIANARDNHRTLNNTRTIIAAFRSAVSPLTVGRLTFGQSNASTFYTRSLSGAPGSPIVIAGPPSYNGGDPATVRLRNVSSSSFQYQLDEWDYKDGGHVSESLDYMVAPSGPRILGTLRADAGSRSLNQNWVTVSFAQSFATAPVVIPQVVTYAGSSAVTVRVRNVSANSFQMRLQEEEGQDGTHNTETVHWIAIETGSTNVGGKQLRVGRTSNSITQNWATLGYGSVSSPRFFASMQTYDGADTAALRYRNFTSSSVQVKVEEEASLDAETNHTSEVVGYFVYQN